MSSETEPVEPELTFWDKVKLFFFGKIGADGIIQIRADFGVLMVGIAVAFLPVLGYLMLLSEWHIIVVSFVMTAYTLFLTFLGKFVVIYFGSKPEELPAIPTEPPIPLDIETEAEQPTLNNKISTTVDDKLTAVIEELEDKKTMLDEAKEAVESVIAEAVGEVEESVQDLSADLQKAADQIDKALEDSKEPLSESVAEREEPEQPQ